MKKILIIILFFFICCSLVKADCSFLRYSDSEVIVSNKNGAVVYDNSDDKGYKKTNEIIPYNTKLKVESDELKMKDDYILSVYSEDGKFDGYVKASDLKSVNDYTNKKPELEKSEYYTYEDTEVRSGPGIFYDIIGVIKGDINVYLEKDIDLESRIEAVKDGAWIYISDGNIGGYIYYDTCAGFLPIKIGQLIKNNNNYYYMGKSDYGIGLKRYDKVNIKYVINDQGHHQSYYIEYNGKNALIDEELIAEKIENELIFLTLDSEYTVLNDIDYITDKGLSLLEDKTLNKKTYLKTNKKYTTKYYNRTSYGFDIYFVEINKKMYRIVYNLLVSNDDLVAYDKNKTYNIEYQGEQIKAYKLLNTYRDNNYYNSISGIISLDNEENEEDNNEEENITDNNQNNIPDDNINDEIENNISDENEDKDEEIITGISSKQYVTWCLIGSIILSAISEILILVLNKSKN